MIRRGSLSLPCLLVVAMTVAATATKNCRRLFRERPSCCLLLDSEVARNNCKAVAANGDPCLCHASCIQRGNCCPDFSAICPQPGNRLQAWCPSQGLDQLFINDIDLLRDQDVAGEGVRTSTSSKQSFWEKRVSRNRFPWHRLRYDFRTLGQKPDLTEPFQHSNEPGLVDLSASARSSVGQGGPQTTRTLRNAPRTHSHGSRDKILQRHLWPWSAIGRILYKFIPKYSSHPVNGGCTGSLIGPRHLLTAAHCLFDRSSRSWHPLVQVFLTSENTTTEASQQPIGWTKMMIPYSYKVLGNKEADYGLIVLDNGFSDSGGWLAFGARSPSTGPLQLVGHDYFAMWSQHNCSVSSASPRSSRPLVVNHSCLATPGMSGSPLIGKRSPGAEDAWRNSLHRATDNVIYAIHTHSQGRRRRSRALEINLCVYHTLCGWLNFEENSSTSRRSKTDNFRQALGEQCSAMTDFVPSLVRRQ